MAAVFSAEAIKLFVNGRYLDQGEWSARFLFTFPNVAWDVGTVRAVGYHANGKEVCAAQP